MITAQAKTERYSQELAYYTLRQFSLARSALAKEQSAAMSKFPAAYSRVARADKMAATLGVPLFCSSPTLAGID